MTDPAVNQHGVYPKPQRLTIAIPKSYGCSAEITLARGNDSQWRYGLDVASPTGKGGECGFLPSIHGTPFPTREEAVNAARAEILAKFLHDGHPKAAETVRRWGSAKPDEGGA